MIQSGTFWVVLGVATILFRIIPRRFRYGALALASFSYLFTLDPVGILVLTGWTLLFFYAAPHTVSATGRKRWIVPILCFGVLGYLAYFKYIPPLIARITDQALDGSIVIPLGISYYVFKLIHYAIEASRGNIKDRSLQQFACYMFLFPIFSAGPIERFDHFLSGQSEHWSLDETVRAITRIAQGLVKKLVIGDIFIGGILGGKTALGLLPGLEGHPTYQVWGFFVLTFLLGYMDFSGYSDIAIGASRLFGIRIMENFNWPIVAPNLADFWQRWHMTLSGWCRAYVYMPMIGLTRNPYIAIYCTFLAIGLWHSGEPLWALWGLYHATGVSIYVTWMRVKRAYKLNIPNSGIWSLPAILITFMYVSAGGCFTSLGANGTVMDGARLLAKLLFINLPG